MSVTKKEPPFIHKLIRPDSDDADSQTLLLLHGTGGNEDDMIPLGRALDEKAALLSPRGKVLENGMPRFFRRYSEGLFDIEDIKFRANELAEFAILTLLQYNLDIRSITAVGYSNGANIATSILLLRPEILNKAVLFRPMVPFVPDVSSNLKGKKVLILSGAFDTIVPQDHPQRLSSILRESGADVTLNLAASGHGLHGSKIGVARNWLSQNRTRN